MVPQMLTGGVWGRELVNQIVLKALWRICQGRTRASELFTKRLRIMVGKGNRTFFWKDL